MKKVLVWVWRIVIGAFVLVLIPLSLWYLICAIETLDYKDHVSNSLPIPFVPALVSAPLGLVLMTWGLVALSWLVFNHERLSLRQIALPWWIGLIGGTSIAVYWLIKLSASNGENDEFVFVPPLISVIVLEVILLIRMCFNSARTPLRPSTSDSLKNSLGCRLTAIPNLPYHGQLGSKSLGLSPAVQTALRSAAVAQTVVYNHSDARGRFIARIRN